MIKNSEEQVNTENLSNLDALKMIARENREYTLEQVSDRFWELTTRKLSKTQMSTLWFTVIGLTENEQDSESISEIEEKSSSSEVDSADIEDNNPKERKLIMSKTVKAIKASRKTSSKEEKSVNLSQTIRSILSKNFDLPIAKVKEKCLAIAGKEPSVPLIFQVKAKMKQGNTIKKKTERVSAVRSAVQAVPAANSYIMDVTEKIKKAKSLIEEFHGKENLISFLQAL
jgi:hypothetical protein